MDRREAYGLPCRVNYHIVSWAILIYLKEISISTYLPWITPKDTDNPGTESLDLWQLDELGRHIRHQSGCLHGFEGEMAPFMYPVNEPRQDP